MTNPMKGKLRPGVALGRGVGSALGAACAAALTGYVSPGPLDWPAFLPGLVGGFFGGILGACLGHWWDSPSTSESSPVDMSGEILMAMVPAGLFAGIAMLSAEYMLFPASPETAHEFLVNPVPWLTRLGLVATFFGFLAGALPAAADTLISRHSTHTGFTK